MNAVTRAVVRTLVATSLAAFFYLVLWRDQPLFGWRWAARRHAARIKRQTRRFEKNKAYLARRGYHAPTTVEQHLAQRGIFLPSTSVPEPTDSEADRG